MADVDRLKTALSDRYTIEREIGSGGMAVVYLAEDLKHKRKVALKVLRAELAAAIGSERFVREIEIAANLSHPHILPLYDSGEAGGLLYYVMPYVEGESLRERLDSDGKIPIAEMVRLTDDIASALSYAHEQGIVHRDIKPENIMLSGGRAVVADFGIARAVTVAGGERLTGTGFAVGTPAYMSPEQAFGESNVDGRSDVYALGCVAYEMVSGRAPFQAETPQALLAKHAADTVPSLRTSDPKIPLFLDRAVERALAKNPADRFPTASAFAEALTSEIVVARVGKRRWTRLAVAAPVALVVLAAAVWGYLTFFSGTGYERLAVLPPVNLMNDSEQEYIIHGMLNGLISELGQAGITIIGSVQSMMRYQDTEMTVREIAAEVGVDAVIESTVLWVGDNVAVDVRLTDGRTEESLWSQSYDEDARNVLALYRQVTGAVADEIQLALTPQAEARLATAREVNPQAYDAYLRGQFNFAKLSSADLETALQYFELALEHDPEYALAYAGIALVWAARSQMGFVRPGDAVPLAMAAVERAVELDSTLVEVQSALAGVRAWHLWDWAGAEVAFERAIEINPNYPEVRAFYSHFLLCMNRPDAAMRQMELAVELDPFNPITQSFHGQVLLMVGRYDEAIAQFERLLQTTPNHPLGHSGLHATYRVKGMYEEAMAAAALEYSIIQASEAEEVLVAGDAEAGYKGVMRRAADRRAELSRVTYVSTWGTAFLYAAAGEDSLALDWLERGLEERNPNMPYLNANPVLAGLRDDPLFQDLARRMGLPE